MTERNLLRDRKSTRLNSSHLGISYAVFCLKKKNTRLNSSHLRISYAVFCFIQPHLVVWGAGRQRDPVRTSGVAICFFWFFFFFFFLKERPPPGFPPFPPPPLLPI